MAETKPQDRASVKGCTDFYTPAVGCCESCHEDDEQGFAQMPEVYTEDGELFAIVCCRHLETANDAALKAKAHTKGDDNA